MKTLDVQQGSPEWLAARAKHHCASEAAAMMGSGKHMSRTELLAQKASGIVQDVDAATQSRFDAGHAAEAKARAIVEEMIGEELYPLTATDDAGYLLASYDGITMDERTGWESKLWNVELASAVRAKELPPAYYWQLEQQCLIAGLQRVVFTCTDGTRENFESMDYFPVAGRAKQLMDGWRQFDEDMKAYQPAPVAIPVTGRALMTLPALNITLRGEVVESNMTLFRSTALEFIESIKTDLQSDQDFADAEKAVKFCHDAEKELEAVETRALSSTQSIDELFRTMRVVKTALRDKRLVMAKLVEARKVAIRIEIAQEGKDAIRDHIKALHRRAIIVAPPFDMATVMKGKRTVASLRDAVATEVARVKIAANEIADRVTANHATLKELAGDFMFLFRDANELAQKAEDDFAAAVKTRIAEHQATEAARVERQRANEAKGQIDVPAPIPTQITPTLSIGPAIRKSNQAATPATYTDTQMLDWIEDHCTTKGGGNGFTLTVFVPHDTEDLRDGICHALTAEGLIPA